MKWLLILQVVDAIGTGWADAAAQLTTSVSFGALAWYLIVKAMPAIEERHRAERVEFLSHMRERDARIEAMLTLLTKALAEMEGRLEKLFRDKS